MVVLARAGIVRTILIRHVKLVRKDARLVQEDAMVCRSLVVLASTDILYSLLKYAPRIQDQAAHHLTM